MKKDPQEKSKPIRPTRHQVELDSLVARSYKPLLAFFRRRAVNQNEVEDLVQEVFARLAKQSEAAHITNGEGYIFQTAANLLRDSARRRTAQRSDSHHAFDEEKDGYTEFSPERIVPGRENVNLVVATLRTLPARSREIFVLRCFEGMKHREIASYLGISVRSVEKHVSKALAKVAKALDGDL